MTRTSTAQQTALDHALAAGWTLHRHPEYECTVINAAGTIVDILARTGDTEVVIGTANGFKTLTLDEARDYFTTGAGFNTEDTAWMLGAIHTVADQLTSDGASVMATVEAIAGTGASIAEVQSAYQDGAYDGRRFVQSRPGDLTSPRHFAIHYSDDDQRGADYWTGLHAAVLAAVFPEETGVELHEDGHTATLLPGEDGAVLIEAHAPGIPDVPVASATATSPAEAGRIIVRWRAEYAAHGTFGA